MTCPPTAIESVACVVLATLERVTHLVPLVGAAGIGVFGYVPWVVGTVVGDWPRPHIRRELVAKLAWGASLLVVANWVYLLLAHA